MSAGVNGLGRINWPLCLQRLLNRHKVLQQRHKVTVCGNHFSSCQPRVQRANLGPNLVVCKFGNEVSWQTVVSCEISDLGERKCTVWNQLKLEHLLI